MPVLTAKKYLGNKEVLRRYLGDQLLQDVGEPLDPTGGVGGGDGGNPSPGGGNPNPGGQVSGRSVHSMIDFASLPAQSGSEKEAFNELRLGFGYPGSVTGAIDAKWTNFPTITAWLWNIDRNGTKNFNWSAPLQALRNVRASGRYGKLHGLFGYPFAKDGTWPREVVNRVNAGDRAWVRDYLESALFSFCDAFKDEDPFVFDLLNEVLDPFGGLTWAQAGGTGTDPFGGRKVFRVRLGPSACNFMIRWAYMGDPGATPLTGFLRFFEVLAERLPNCIKMWQDFDNELLYSYSSTAKSGNANNVKARLHLDVARECVRRGMQLDGIAVQHHADTGYQCHPDNANRRPYNKAGHKAMMQAVAGLADDATNLRFDTVYYGTGELDYNQIENSPRNMGNNLEEVYEAHLEEPNAFYCQLWDPFDRWPAINQLQYWSFEPPFFEGVSGDPRVTRRYHVPFDAYRNEKKDACDGIRRAQQTALARGERIETQGGVVGGAQTGGNAHPSYAGFKKGRVCDAEEKPTSTPDFTGSSNSEAQVGSWGGFPPYTDASGNVVNPGGGIYNSGGGISRYADGGVTGQCYQGEIDNPHLVPSGGTDPGARWFANGCEYFARIIMRALRQLGYRPVLKKVFSLVHQVKSRNTSGSVNDPTLHLFELSHTDGRNYYYLENKLTGERVFQYDFPVPIGPYSLIEVDIAHSKTGDGYYRVYQDGRLILRMENISTYRQGAPGEEEYPHQSWAHYMGPHHTANGQHDSEADVYAEGSPTPRKLRVNLDNCEEWYLPSSRYDPKANTATLSNSLELIGVPDEIEAGEVLEFEIDVEAESQYEVVSVLQPNSSGDPTYANNTQVVQAGNARLQVRFEVPTNIPNANNAYKVLSYMAPANQGYGARVALHQERDISATGGQDTGSSGGGGGGGGGGATIVTSAQRVFRKEQLSITPRGQVNQGTLEAAFGGRPEQLGSQGDLEVVEVDGGRRLRCHMPANTRRIIHIIKKLGNRGKRLAVMYEFWLPNSFDLKTGQNVYGGKTGFGLVAGIDITDPARNSAQVPGGGKQPSIRSRLSSRLMFRYMSQFGKTVLGAYAYTNSRYPGNPGATSYGRDMQLDYALARGGYYLVKYEVDISANTYIIDVNGVRQTFNLSQFGENWGNGNLDALWLSNFYGGPASWGPNQNTYIDYGNCWIAGSIDQL